jgi:hypothetical protein
LGHPFWGRQSEVEKLGEKTHFSFPMEKSSWNVVYVKFRFILEYAAVRRSWHFQASLKKYV